MSSLSIEPAEAAGMHASPPAHPSLEVAARFGYAACGTVYAVIGIAAIAVAFGLAERPAGSHGVMAMLGKLPFGPLVLIGLGVGLAGYAALNFAGAIADPERRGWSFRGIVTRSVDVLTGAVYIALAIAALGRVADPAKEDAGTAVAWAHAILALPLGQVILGGAGAALMFSGGYLFYRAFSERFGEMLDRRATSVRGRAVIARAARAGTAARGLIFVICGVLVLRSAVSGDPDIVGDAGEALAMLGQTFLGPVLLAIAGAGFVAYGAYQLAKARYQRIAGVKRNFPG